MLHSEGAKRLSEHLGRENAHDVIAEHMNRHPPRARVHILRVSRASIEEPEIAASLEHDAGEGNGADEIPEKGEVKSLTKAERVHSCYVL